MSKNRKKELANSAYGKQESLQAIVFADDFNHNLEPADKIYPNILLPVVNCPLLDYLLETLVRSKVQQVFLYCSNHVEQLKEFINSWSSHECNNMVITPIVSDGCRSLGDALRHIDTKGCVRGDFILIRGTSFANIDLQNFMDLHRARKEKDKNTAMTMIFRDFGNLKDSALKNETSLVVANANTRKLLHYNKINSNQKKSDLELQWFLEEDQVSINTALLDTHIYLCSQSVLPLFADNFDFQTMEDFINGVLMNEEFLDSRIYWEPLTCATYALSISSWKGYQILCRDILQHQCYPLVPDTLPLSLRNVIRMPKNTYKHPTSTLSKGCTIHSESLVGENSFLGQNSFVQRSVIGPKCVIGVNVKINNSFIISNVTIEDNCNINNSIIFSNCVLKKGIKLDACTLMPNVICTENYSHASIEAGDNLLSKEMEHHTDESSNTFPTFFDDDFKANNDNDDASSSSSVSSKWSSSSLEDSSSTPLVQDDNEMFLSEVIDSLLRGYQDKVKCENLILEINSSRYAYNVSMRQVSYNVIKAILILPLQECLSKADTETILNSGIQSSDYFKIIKTVLTVFKPIILNYIKTENAQEDCLRAIQDVAYTNQEFVIPCAQILLSYFYNIDILCAEKIIDWYDKDCNNDIDINYSDTDNDDDHHYHPKQEKKQNGFESFRTAISPYIEKLKKRVEDESSSDE